MRENGCRRVLHINGFLFTERQRRFVFSQIWQAWIQRSHTSETEGPNVHEIIYGLETVQKWTFVQIKTKLEIQEYRAFF